MPRYEYRVLKPVPAAEKAFLAWIDELDRKFTNRDPEFRSDVVREACTNCIWEDPTPLPIPPRHWRCKPWSILSIPAMRAGAGNIR